MRNKSVEWMKRLFLLIIGIWLIGNGWFIPGMDAAEETPMQLEQILFSDDFNHQDTGWEVTKDDYYNSYYVDGEYAIDIFKKAVIFNTTEKINIPTAYYAIEAEMRSVRPNSGIYGIFINYSPVDKEYYQFVIYPDVQLYRLVKQGPKYSDVIIGWKSSMVIKDDESMNKLRIEVFGNLVKLFVNGEYLRQIKIDDLKEQRKVGVIAISSGEPVAIRYDHFVLGKLDESWKPPKKVAQPQYIFIEGNLEGAIEKEAFKTIEDSIQYMSKIWGVQLSEPARIYMYRTGIGYKDGLKKICGLPEPIAQETARDSIAVASYYNILVNKRALVLDQATKNTMCHEMIHIFQHDAYFNGREIDPLRCIAEGYAYMASEMFTGEWPEYKKNADAMLRLIINQFGTNLPDLISIKTSKQYSQAMESFGVENFKYYMVAAMEFLLEKAGGHQAFYTYFSGGPADATEGEVFEKSFGLKPEEFNKQFLQYLTELAAQKLD